MNVVEILMEMNGFVMPLQIIIEMYAVLVKYKQYC